MDDGYEHMRQAIRAEAERRTEERFSNSASNQIKNLNASVVSALGDLPVVGEAIAKTGGAITNAFGLFTDNVLAPIFGFDDREARKRERERQERIIQKTIRKTAIRQRQIEDNRRGAEEFQRKAEDAGFETTAEYRMFLRKMKKERMKNKI